MPSLIFGRNDMVYRVAQGRGAADPLFGTEAYRRFLGDPPNGAVIFLQLGQRFEIRVAVEMDAGVSERFVAVLAVQGREGPFSGRFLQPDGTRNYGGRCKHHIHNASFLRICSYPHCSRTNWVLQAVWERILADLSAFACTGCPPRQSAAAAVKKFNRRLNRVCLRFACNRRGADVQ